MKIDSPIYSVVEQTGMFGFFLVHSFTHCVQAVLRAPHCGDGGLYPLKRAGLPGISVNHAPNTGHHC